MNSKNKVISILILIILVAIGLQTFKLGIFERLFGIKQFLNKEDEDYISIPRPDNYRKILVIYSDDEDGHRNLYNNVYHTFNMAKLNYDLVKVDSIELNDKIQNLSNRDLLIIATEKTDEISSIKSVTDYVKYGGKAVVLLRGNSKEINNIAGIIENNGYYPKGLTGFKFEKEIFPGLDEMEIKDGAVFNSSLDVILDQNVKVLATAEDKPIIWTNDFGEGSVLYVNSTLFMDKVNRGLMIQYISYINDYFLTTIFNGKVVNIDDFPAPIRHGKHNTIYDEYKIKNREFYRNIWWSSLYDIAEKYNVKYTGLIIGTYNGLTNPPLDDLTPEEVEDIKYFGRRLAEINGELGIHGYNHNSLALNGQINFDDYDYSPWKNQDAMEEGLRILKNRLKSIYGDIRIYTYVPPSNIISKEGKKAVKNVFEEIKVFAGLYTGEEEKGVLYQEFGKDPHVENVYSFPRFSSGYQYNQDTMWSIYNAIAHYGLFNHFIHPDDILDEKRSQGKTWSILEEELSTIFEEVYKNYSFLRPMTNMEAYTEYRKQEKLRVYTVEKENIIEIHYENLISSRYHYLRLRDKEILGVVDGEFSIIDRDTGLYLIKGDAPFVKVILK